MGAILMAAACNDYETYGELKERERDAIDQFINDSGYVIISQDQFEEQGNKTIGDKQFVQLNKSGVYMQIVNVGSGETIKDGESMNILCRFIEKSILDTVKLSNYTNDNPFSLDIMSVTRTGSTYTASFTQGLMLNNYGSTVPEAWLAPLQYIKLGRLASDTDEKAHVKLIVPHSQGTTSNAKANVRPYYYIIKFQRGR
ncbi:MAG: DUF4827 domain-containing protein [Prevotella sp.]|nr:DUF4827 domain-containing protein [Prevotella sp.]